MALITETLGKNCGLCKHFYEEHETAYDDNLTPKCPKCGMANGGIWNETKATKIGFWRINEK